MAAATDADFNAASRVIDGKIEMYIYGEGREPLVLSKNNKLIDISLLDEASANSSNPFGSITSNELSFTVYNDNGEFSPTNASSPYYGRMRKGVKCEAFLKAGASDWVKVGTFYVTEWKATITGITATITANDKLYDVFALPDLDIPVVKNETFLSFYTRTFNALGVAASVDSSLTEVLAMSYATGTNSVLLSNMAVGAMALCYCDHNGTIAVKPLTASQPIRATLTDNDQIISANAEFSITAGYEGASVTCTIPQESDIDTVLSVSELNIVSGDRQSVAMDLSKTPLVRLAYASLIGEADAEIISMLATSKTVRVTTSATNNMTLPLVVAGTYVESVSSTIGSTASNVLAIDNIYVQNMTYAERFLQVLTRFVESPLPMITLDIRGNPLLNMGDLLRVQSTKYNLNFDGILLRQAYTYNGALSSQITLLDASLLEVG